MGTIGSAVARFAQVLGMHVIGIRRKPRAAGDPVDEMHAFDDFRSLLPRCDWIVLACPLVPQTRGIINVQSLALMKKSAGLINVARGAIRDVMLLPSVVHVLAPADNGGGTVSEFGHKDAKAAGITNITFLDEDVQTYH